MFRFILLFLPKAMCETSAGTAYQTGFADSSLSEEARVRPRQVNASSRSRLLEKDLATQSLELKDFRGIKNKTR